MRRVLMTLDAVGGVWSYAMETATALAAQGMVCRLLGFGPPPVHPIALPRDVDMVWTDEPLDWLVADAAALNGVGPALLAAARDWRADIVHLSAPSQAAGLPHGLAAVVQSNSCVPSWWAAVRGGELPPAWRWQFDRNRAGFHRADCVIVPSASHGQAISRLYGALPRLRVVPNATSIRPPDNTVERKAYVFAAGRWWDQGKNGHVLDAAAPGLPWPVLMAGAMEGPNGARLSLNHAVSLGQLPGPAMRTHMAQAGIFAAPCKYEPFGLAVLEAASLGACLLLADIATFRELWHGAACFVDPDDPAAWRDAITALASDPGQRLVLGEQARTRAAGFTFDNQRTGLLAAYTAALQVQSRFSAELV